MSKKITKEQTDFLVKLMKQGKTRFICKNEFEKKFKRTVCLEILRQLARKNNIDSLKNSGHFNKLESNFIIEKIKENVSKRKVMKAFKEKFNKSISKSVVKDYGEQIGHVFDRKTNQEDTYSKEELSILRGFVLLGEKIENALDSFPNRTFQGVRLKMIELRRDGSVGDNVKNEIIAGIKKGASNQSLSKKHNIDAKFIKEFREKKVKSSNVEIKNLKRWEDADVNQILDLVEKAQERLKNLDSEQNSADITIKTTSKYIALTFLSDFHLENVNTNVVQLRKDLNIIKNTKDFYMGFGGDLIDNFAISAHRDGVFEAVIPAKAARIASVKLFESIKTKVLWILRGCHDDWEKGFDYDLTQHIARKISVPYLGAGGDINLTVNNQKCRKKVEYSIHARHKYRGSSGINNGTACCKNILRDIDSKFDVVAVAHNHFSEIKLEHYLGKLRVFLRTGSYKREDRYSKTLGYVGNDFNMDIPVVFLNSQTKEMKIVSGIKNAADLLRALNK